MEYPVGQWGGVEVLVKELIAGLSDSFDILLASDDLPEKFAGSPQARQVASHFSWKPGASYPEQARRLAAWLRAEGAEVVHFHLGGTYAMRTRSWGQSPIPIVAEAGIPCVATNHGAFSIFDFCAPSRPFVFRLAMLPVFWAGRMRTIRALRAEVTVSDNDCANMRRWFPPFAGKFRRIYHSQLSGDEPMSEVREKTILCLGTIGRRKGQPFLVEAFSRIAGKFPDWTLIIAGRQDSGLEEMEAIRRIVSTRTLCDRVLLPGAVSNEEAMRLMMSCGIFAMPSLAEGLGLSLQEALFRGCPAVASRVGGIRDMVIDGETGWLAEPGSPDELAAVLERAMTSEPLRRQYGRAARARITALGMNRGTMLERHRELYASVMLQS